LDNRDKEQNQILGENYFLRAFSHFNLLRFYAKPYTFGGQDNLSDPGTASHKMREGSGFRNRGFFIEFKERDRSINKADLK